MSKKVIVLLAEGFEEVEAITPVDYLRRAGIDVTTAAIGIKNGENTVKSARGIPVIADAAFSSLMEGGKAGEWDGVVVPGGLPGSDNLAASADVGAFLVEMAGAGKLVSAICAAPARVLCPLGLLKGKNFTCYPGEEEKVLAFGSSSPGAAWREDRVVIDGNLITSRSAGSAGEFACAIISYLLGKEEGEKIAQKVLLNLKNEV
ncbi:MAG: DJ-1/PfpI family protein [Treponema sp.]|nr:DJ-1/PfpI family protein [Treponema sp.]